jgi:DNA-binding response OmpR family regulator
MMTGYGSEHPLVKEAIISGVDDLLHKPFDLDELLASLTKVFVK